MALSNQGPRQKSHSCPEMSGDQYKDEAASEIIGQLLPNVIEVSDYAVVAGSLAFFIPSDDENVKRSVFLSLMTRFPNKNIGDTIADLPKDLAVIEHLSGLRAEVNGTKAFSQMLWDTPAG